MHNMPTGFEMLPHQWAQWMERQFRRGNLLNDDEPLIGEPVIAIDISVEFESEDGQEELLRMGLKLFIGTVENESQRNITATACHIVMIDYPV